MSLQQGGTSGRGREQHVHLTAVPDGYGRPDRSSQFERLSPIALHIALEGLELRDEHDRVFSGNDRSNTGGQSEPGGEVPDFTLLGAIVPQRQ